MQKILRAHTQKNWKDFFPPPLKICQNISLSQHPPAKNARKSPRAKYDFLRYNQEKSPLENARKYEHPRICAPYYFINPRRYACRRAIGPIATNMRDAHEWKKKGKRTERIVYFEIISKNSDTQFLPSAMASIAARGCLFNNPVSMYCG